VTAAVLKRDVSPQIGCMDGRPAAIRPHCSAMYALAPKRCPHCGRVVATVSLEHAEKFDVHGPLVVCERCDSAPH
jgi:hypothetical protein